MLPDKSVMCPYTGFAKSCFEGVTSHSCPKWVHLTGTDPNTGKQYDNFGCADTFIPVLLVEVASQSRQTGAAVESFRNEMVRVGNGPALPSFEPAKMIAIN